MGAPLFALVVALMQVPQTDSITPDTGAFASPAVRELVERATARRRMIDSAVSDYQATVHYRLSLGFSRRQWAPVPPAVVEEQVGRIQWQLPNDLRVDIEGRRGRSRSGTVELSSIFDRPWFVPRGVGDSVRIFSNDFPATGALHPLSSAGPAWYRYEQVGGVGVALPDGTPLRLIEIAVTPRRTGPALIVGRLWVDSASADVVRMTFRYVGTALWARVGDARPRDSSEARRINAIANRVIGVNADLEYALQNGRYWMPYKQVVFGTARIPIISDLVIPFRATTVFDDYEINTGRRIAFTVPVDSLDPRARRDSIRARRRREDVSDRRRSWDVADRWTDGRYEIHRPSDDSLSRYSGWTKPLTLANPHGEDEALFAKEAMLAAASEELSGELTGQTTHSFGYERISDAVQYNRVQGLSLGLGYRVRVPATRFTSAYGTVRYGFSDQRLTGRLTLRSDAPSGRVSVSGYHELRGVDPFAPGLTIPNSLNAIFTAHDDGDYLLASGASFTIETSLAVGLDLAVGARAEREVSVSQSAKSAVNDFLGGTGTFPPNPPIEEGTFGGGFVRLDGIGVTRWTVTADVLGGNGRAAGRLFGDVRRGFGGRQGATVRVKAGLGTEPVFPQSAFRLGGLNTVRGFPYAFVQAPSFWAAQLDVSPLGGPVRPVLFVDAGQAARTADLFSSEALVGGGIGLSLLRGLVRFDFSVPMTPDIGGKVRFDLVIGGVR